ncbi:MAG: DUF3142 domain-containing protein [Opitutae bacterium]|nr:DUF3142 domain-containing protein [Opitutae bacterium]
MRSLLLFAAALGTFLPAGIARSEISPPRPTHPLAHDIYVWQRQHGPAVSASVRAHAATFQTVVALAAEISWEKSPAASAPTPLLTRVALDWSSLATAPRLGLALRINARPGRPTRADDGLSTVLALTRAVLADAAAHRVRVAELQIDCDAPTSRLADYRLWLEALRAAVAPVPLVFTALPAWLDSPDFATLARSADGFVLQVHSVTRPRDARAPFSLCDPAAALAAIARAARVGVAFRVALPTYGYFFAFAPDGRFAGLAAEGPRRDWDASFTVREVQADPGELARLVRALATDPPSALTGVIWYRLPVATDSLNWSWPTLAAVMQGRPPVPRLRLDPRATAAGLTEIFLHNDGDGDLAAPVRLRIRWAGSPPLAADALGPFSITQEDAASLVLAAPLCRLPAGRHAPVGWLRLTPTARPPDVSLEN